MSQTCDQKAALHKCSICKLMSFCRWGSRTTKWTSLNPGLVVEKFLEKGLSRGSTNHTNSFFTFFIAIFVLLLNYTAQCWTGTLSKSLQRHDHSHRHTPYCHSLPLESRRQKSLCDSLSQKGFCLAWKWQRLVITELTISLVAAKGEVLIELQNDVCYSPAIGCGCNSTTI